MKTHEKFMKKCLDLAILGIKKTKTNPLVGCVITYENQIISSGYHQEFGGPHAEVNAINALIQKKPKEHKEILKKATLYVNLEPCAHYGKTPPCINLIIKYKINKIVIGTLDPSPKVNGIGVKKLQKHATVYTGVLATECKQINYKYFTHHHQKRPFIILKWAESKDGFINNNSKGSTQISCNESITKTHQWRSEVDGIMVGTNTVLCDNPILTTRKYKGKNPIRITIDRKNKLDSQKWNIKNQHAKTIILQEEKNEEKNHIKYVNYLTNKVNAKSSDSQKLKNIMHVLYAENIHSIIIEGGAKIINNLISQNLWDEARIFTSEKKLHNGVKSPKKPATQIVEEITFGDDNLKIFENNLNKNNHSSEGP